MKLLVDENVPLARELFGSLGQVTLAPGREVTPEFPGLEEFDALVIRSVTPVTPALVDRATKARVIGTATIGTDHVDTAYIEAANARRANPITVLAAPGSNADSVADHVGYALGHLTRGRRRPLAESSLGIVGLGNCGSRVARRAEGFGMRVVRCDPPLAEREPGFVSEPLEEALGADFVTLHVPLTQADECRHPTGHMIDAGRLALMRRDARLINTSRGGVVDSQALVEALTAGSIGGAVLDVFEGEPEPPAALIALAELATPHVAGYAVEGKRRGAVVIHQGICRAFGVEPRPSAELLLAGFEAPRRQAVEFAMAPDDALAADNALRALFAATHDIAAVSSELKATIGADQRGALFDRMRRDYERDYARHELAVYRVGIAASVGAGLRREIARRLKGFGVTVSDESPHYVLAPAIQRPSAGQPT